MLRNLTFVVQFSYFGTSPKAVFVFRATFEQLSSQKTTFYCFLSNFLRIFRENFWKISSNLWKALNEPSRRNFYGSPPHTVFTKGTHYPRRIISALTTTQGPVVRRPISANPGLNFNPGFFFLCSKAFSRIFFSLLFRVSNHHL